jgi:hypothetical protein
MGRISHRRVTHKRASHSVYLTGMHVHWRATHRRVPHGSVSHRCTPHRHVLYGRVYSRSPPHEWWCGGRFVKILGCKLRVFALRDKKGPYLPLHTGTVQVLSGRQSSLPYRSEGGLRNAPYVKAS